MPAYGMKDLYDSVPDLRVSHVTIETFISSLPALFRIVRFSFDSSLLRSVKFSFVSSLFLVVNSLPVLFAVYEASV